MPEKDEDPDLHSLIVNTFGWIDRWEVACASGFHPVPGSELEADDEDWPAMPVSQVATIGLGSAVDHLDAVRGDVESRTLYVYAQLSTIRGALVGAAQTVWVLAPDERNERVARGRLIAQHMYEQQRKHLMVVKHGREDEYAELEAFLAERLEEIRAKRAADGERGDLDTTRMIRDAATTTFGRRDLAAEAEGIWRRTSGAAHGFSWALLGVEDTTLEGEPDEHGRGTFVAAGGLPRITNSYRCAFLMIHKGFSLWAQRGGRYRPGM